jgi:hypothetical protein
LLFFNSLFELWKVARRAAKRPHNAIVSQRISDAPQTWDPGYFEITLRISR